MEKMELLSRNDFIDTVNTFLMSNRGANCHIVFKRTTPKCHDCEKKSNKWKEGIDTHCACGGRIEYEKNCLYAKIQSIDKNKDSFFYFEGGHAMRQCKIDNLISISFCIGNGEQVTLFYVKDAPKYLEMATV